MSTFLTQSLANKLQNDSIFKVSEEPVAQVNYGHKQFQRGAHNRGHFLHQKGGGRGKPAAPQESNTPPTRDIVNQGRYSRGRGGTQRQPNTRVFMASEKAGVQRNGCYLCGNLDHGWKDPVCAYAGQDLKQTPCKWCHTGLHAQKEVCFLCVRKSWCT